jgi:hypothetical protein
MNVPQSLYLSNQTFNSNFLEFVWQFPAKEEEQDQVILRVQKNGSLYIEGGVVNLGGDYKQTFNRPDYFVDGVTVEWLKNVPANSRLNFIKKFFTFDPGLVSLANEAIEYLKSV